MKLKSSDLLRDFVALLYPNLCLACNEKAPIANEIFCVRCYYKLPYTNFKDHSDNLITDRFWGRIEVEAVFAMLYFTKGGIAQRIIHNLKYKGQKRVGIHLGEMYGRILKQKTLHQDLDLIVPVPLHYSKERKRGFNQSKMFATGLSKELDIPVLGNALFRKSNLSSQTIKSRMERLENVLDSFEVALADQLKGKNILLVDDVITTGATLEACAIKILAIPDTKLSIATIAIAK